MKIYTFDEILERSKDSSKALLIGNGFSRSISNNFDYRNLLVLANDVDLLDDQALPKGVEHIFDDLDTCDFEKVIAYLNISEKVLTSYIRCDGIPREIKITQRHIHRDKDKIKTSFIAAISHIHSKLFRKITYSSNELIEFIGQFNSVFTINYDLILYWLMMELKHYLRMLTGFEIEESCRTLTDFNDGFWPSGWGTYSEEGREQNVYYLHGNLFIDGTNKLKFSKNNTIIDQIKSYIDRGEYEPLLVFEGKYMDKLEKIKKSPYLNYCYQKLGQTDSHLIIIGASLNEHGDKHLFDQIKRGQYKSISYGLYDINNQTQIDYISTLRQDIQFFDTSTAICWQTLQEDMKNPSEGVVY